MFSIFLSNNLPVPGSHCRYGCFGMLGVPPLVPSTKLQTALLEQRPFSQIIGDGTQNQRLVI